MVATHIAVIETAKKKSGKAQSILGRECMLGTNSSEGKTHNVVCPQMEFPTKEHD